MKFVRNTWYCAAWSESIGRGPIQRKFLGEAIVLYRSESGDPVALSNRCPHRFAPMHKGCLKGDAIECPQHGLRVEPSAACVYNPHGDGKIPRAAKLKPFPPHERDGIVWIWMGETEKADPASCLPSAMPPS